jgi:DNA-binding protein Fis
MSDHEEIDWQDLGLDESGAVQPSTQAPAPQIESSPQPEVEAVQATGEEETTPHAGIQTQMGSPRDALRKGLELQVRTALESGAMPPLGRWLISDLVLEADAEANGVARQASALLGMAETTFRRQLDKARQELLTGHSLRNSDWPALKRVFRQLIAEQPRKGESLLDEVGKILLQELVAQIPHNDNLGSALLGVTKPTYQRRKVALGI